jgi:hypothetical protein
LVTAQNPQLASGYGVPLSRMSIGLGRAVEAGI